MFPHRVQTADASQHQGYLVPRSHKFQTSSPCPKDRGHRLQWRLPTTGRFITYSLQPWRIPKWLNMHDRFSHRQVIHTPQHYGLDVTKGRSPVCQ